MVQRVRTACVAVRGKEVARIGHGLLVYLAVAVGDGQQDCLYIADKLQNLRCFEDEQGKMNLSVQAVGGQILLVSNFTVCGDCRKGRRPSFDQSAGPQTAQALYLELLQLLGNTGIQVQAGLFGQHMEITSVNDGPVSLLLDSRRAF